VSSLSMRTSGRTRMALSCYQRVCSDPKSMQPPPFERKGGPSSLRSLPVCARYSRVQDGHRVHPVPSYPDDEVDSSTTSHIEDEETEFLRISRDVHLRLQSTQAETFFSAFEARFLNNKFKIPEEGRKAFRDLAAEGKLKTVIKYALAQPMAALTRYGRNPILEMPPVPKGYEAYEGYGNFLIIDLLRITGTAKMRLYSHLTEVVKDPVTLQVRPSLRSIKLCFELTQLKNICPKLTFQEVVDAIADHRATLTDSTNPVVTRRVERIVNTLAQSIFDPLIVFESLPPGTLTDRAATVQTARGEGEEQFTFNLKSGFGFKAEISGIDLYPGNLDSQRRQEYKTTSYSLGQSRLTKMDFTPKGGLNYLSSRPDRVDTEDELLEPYLNQAEYPLTGLTAKVVALLEPLKVRTISIDSGILRYLASRIQKYLWNTLSKYRVFDLIKGVPVEDTLEFMISNLPFVSGDYKGATDSIFHNSTDLWVKQIFDRIAVPPHLRSHIEAIKRDFTRVLLDYSDVYDQEGRRFLKAYCDERGFVLDAKILNAGFWTAFGYVKQLLPEVEQIKNLITDLDPVRQARGQLMGNVLSFPILCLINLTGYLVAAEKFVNEIQKDDFDSISADDRATWHLLTEFFDYGEGGVRRLIASRKMLDRLPVRVNGDDILFQASVRFYLIWSASIIEVGFQKSVGKNYFSEFFFTVNSQIFYPGTSSGKYTYFLYGPHRMNHIWWSGLSPDFLRRRTDFRSLVGKDSATIADSRTFLSAVQRDFLETVPSGQRKLWNSLFLENNREFLDSFDSYERPLRVQRKGEDPKRIPRGSFRVSRTLPVRLGGLGIELNEPEHLTHSQKVLALRLALADGKSPFTLGETPFINTLLRPFRRYFDHKYPIRTVSWREKEQLEEKFQVVPLTQFMIIQMSRLYPLWREPPPDDISFHKEELASYTERMFKWSLQCRRALKANASELTLDELNVSTVPVDRVILFPKDVSLFGDLLIE